MLLGNLTFINYNRINLRQLLKFRNINRKMLENEKSSTISSALEQQERTLTTSNNDCNKNSKNNMTNGQYVRQIPTLRHNKVGQKKKTYIPGTVTLQILGAGANGAPSSVYLFTDQTRYLFNCGEGTQRLAVEHKTKLARLEHIFFTRNTWDMIGGLPGLALTLQDSGVVELAIHGPPHLSNILQSMNRFVVFKTLKLTTNDITVNENFEDCIMTINHIILNKSSQSADNEPTNVVTMYLCKLKPRPGALLLDKCVEFGVNPGPQLGQLKNGQDVQLADGTIVKAADVTEPPETDISFLFIDIPDEEYLPALQAQFDYFKNLQKNVADQLTAILHFTPDSLLSNHTYKTFINLFNNQTQHIYLNSNKNGFSGFTATHRIQQQLNLLSPHVFPLLAECENENSIIMKRIKLAGSETGKELHDVHFNAVTSMACYHLRPNRSLDQSLETKLDAKSYIDEAEKLENFSELLTQLKSEYKPNKEAANKYPKITFLGTGSCIPNKTRNVSGILVHALEDSYMLFDCGEGTFGQIVRLFGSEKSEHIIRNLKAIYISHLHADHHIGLIALLNERRRLKCTNKLLLFSPIQINFWLNFYNKNIESISNEYELIPNSEMLVNQLNLKEIHPELGINSIQTCLVRHCVHSYGVSVVIPEHIINGNSIDAACRNIKITYSGDTMPCDDLINIGENSTILIHEATMEDDLVEEAKIKTHSTISQAIAQGHAMNAEYIILTHFSQRYAKLPRMQNLNSFDMKNIAIAFDNMQVTVDDLKSFHLFYPALNALFAEHNTELESKAIKRELKLERKRKLLSIT